MSETTEASNSRAWIRQLVDFGALVAFAVAFFVTRDLITAGWVLAAASGVALTVGYLVEKRIAPLPAFAGVVALVFSVLAFVFDDPTFIKLKFTIQNGLLALLLLGSLPFRKYPLKVLLGEVFPLTDEGWRAVTLRYGLYFAAIALVNELVWRTQSDSTWVKFRIGVFFVAIVFGAVQVYLLRNHLLKDDEAGPTSPDPGL
jgi:intracellular septation protein